MICHILVVIDSDPKTPGAQEIFALRPALARRYSEISKMNGTAVAALVASTVRGALSTEPHEHKAE